MLVRWWCYQQVLQDFWSSIRATVWAPGHLCDQGPTCLATLFGQTDGCRKNPHGFKFLPKLRPLSTRDTVGRFLLRHSFIKEIYWEFWWHEIKMMGFDIPCEKFSSLSSQMIKDNSGKWNTAENTTKRVWILLKMKDFIDWWETTNEVCTQ